MFPRITILMDYIIVNISISTKRVVIPSTHCWINADYHHSLLREDHLFPYSTDRLIRLADRLNGLTKV